MPKPSHELVLDRVRQQWEQGAPAQAGSTMPGMLRNAVAIALTVAGLVAFCAGLLGNKEHGDDGTDTGAGVVPAQCTELHVDGASLHAEHGAADVGPGA
ncbi:hypothetical protein [Xanthomonas arboricola]|uniref:hypothetical protein n=1 Tax=Xanthomonas arboricola TaxID=56448 RepID=UPI0017DE3329|nr:hypothetical protein [Xanthomonas arboricola]MBB4726367.1 hypothetical protein [Xanthomonas arboricola]